ncbi:hypothetical protein [Actinoplanes sp. GCM10030250]|uniref:hypothetical protein n=1 Tax=Actinoplanes sp. GCM10030250 TaxID=3273376 RepID=UPI0036108F3F
MDPQHRELAEIALRAAGDGHGLALAGGYAVREHGMGNRPSGDVDLFTDWQRSTAVHSPGTSSTSMLSSRAAAIREISFFD